MAQAPRNRAGEFVRFADAFADALLLVAADGAVVAVNAAARRNVLGGTAPAEGARLESLVADPPEKVREFLRICSRSARSLPGTFRFRGDDGADWHCEGSALREQGGTALVVLRIVPKRESVQRFVALNQRVEQLRREVARRLSAEKTAREQQELLQVTLGSIGDGVITTDDRGVITFMNAVGTRLTGWSEQEAVGMALEDVFAIRNEDTGSVVESPVRKVLREGSVVGLANHTVLIRKDGTRLPIDDSGAPIRDREGHLFGVVLVFHEISERRRMERELLRQARELREADRRKDEFLAMLAHELRNPLASLRNAVELLQLKGAEADVERLAEIMDRQTAQLTRLVDDLLDVARITRGTIRLERRPTDLSAVIDHAIETVRPLIEEKDHRLAVSVPREALVVDADPARLSQVFANLLSNAAKFTSDGGEVGLTAAPEAGRRVVVTVRDTGSGMEPELLSQVFDLFTQGTRSLDRREGGLGIGLTLVKTLVEMHDGQVGVSSEGAGCGSEFFVSLPLAAAGQEGPAGALEPEGSTARTVSTGIRKPDVSVTEPSEPEASEAKASETEASDAEAGHDETGQAGVSVLVVDDNRDAAETLAVLLASFGCTARLATDGPSAIESARSDPPDVVLLDIGLPGMDGYEVARRLRCLPRMSRARIFALSGYSEGVDDGERSAFDKHLTKPLSSAALRRLVSSVSDST